MRRIAEYKQTGTRQEEKTILIPAEYDENGEITIPAHDETITVDVPVMGMVYRDMTAEEEAQALAEQEHMPQEPQDPVCARVKECEDALCELAEMLSEVL